MGESSAWQVTINQFSDEYGSDCWSQGILKVNWAVNPHLNYNQKV